MTRENIEDKLREHGVSPTAQRVEVAEILLGRPQHLSADQIIDRLKSAGSAVSKATVYNTLNLFSKNCLVREVSVDAGRKYYDSTTHAHHHIYHVDTGTLTDIPADHVTITDLPPLPPGTEEESVQVLIRVRDRQR